MEIHESRVFSPMSLVVNASSLVFIGLYVDVLDYVNSAGYTKT